MDTFSSHLHIFKENLVKYKGFCFWIRFKFLKYISGCFPLFLLKRGLLPLPAVPFSSCFSSFFFWGSAPALSRETEPPLGLWSLLYAGLFSGVHTLHQSMAPVLLTLYLEVASRPSALVSLPRAWPGFFSLLSDPLSPWPRWETSGPPLPHLSSVLGSWLVSCLYTPSKHR